LRNELEPGPQAPVFSFAHRQTPACGDKDFATIGAMLYQRGKAQRSVRQLRRTPLSFLQRTIAAICLGLAINGAALPAAHAEEGVSTIFKNALEKLFGGEAQKDKQAIQKPREDPTAPKNEARVPQSREEVQLSFSPVVKRVAGSVVNVYGSQTAREVQSPFAGDPFFERFFGQQPQRRRGQTSLGSGVVVTKDGTILTNNHVIANMDVVKIALADGREFDCDIVLADERSDLAVLKVKDGGQTFQPIEIGDSDKVEVGDLVLAIGNPFGVGQTVTMGIVSAVSRTLAGVNDYGFFIQTDASINPGNSGGALVDMNGRLIGINTMIFSRSGGSIGLGYAIPSNMTQIVLRSAQSGGAVTRPWLGASFQPVTSDIAESLGLQRPRGAMVTEVAKDSPAQKAGLVPGDIVLSINGNEVDHPDALGYRLDTIGVGATAQLGVLSRGNEKTLDVKLVAPPETVPREEIELPEQSVLWGGRIANLSPAVGQEIGLPDAQGVVFLSVAQGSPAALNGMRRGDIVRQINGVDIERTKDVLDVTTKRSRVWQFVVERDGRTVVFERNGGMFRQYVR
jgi:Do/DeqQ family serine protease